MDRITMPAAFAGMRANLTLKGLLMKKAHKKPLRVLYVKFRLFGLEIVVYFKR